MKLMYKGFFGWRKGIDSGMQLIDSSEYFQCVSAQLPPIVPPPIAMNLTPRPHSVAPMFGAFLDHSRARLDVTETNNTTPDMTASGVGSGPELN
jgi:hypothetical protein